MSDWLLPASRHVRFGSSTGRAVDPGFLRLQDAAIAGRLHTATCDVRGPLVDAWTGDVVWFFSEELEVGVFAVGRVRRPTNSPKGTKPGTRSATTGTVTVAIDVARTRLLAADPLPATTMRRWVPELRQGAVALDLRPRALTVLEAWQGERADRDAELLGPLGVTPWRTATKRRTKAVGSPGRRRHAASPPATVGTAATGSGSGSEVGSTPPAVVHPAQDDVLGPVARLLRSQDFAIGVVKGSTGGNPVLVGRRVRDVVIVHVERSRGAASRTATLASYGLLRERKWRLERESARDLRLRVSLWMAFVARPHDEIAAFLEDEDVLVGWQQRKGVVELTDRSKQRWYQYLGVR